MSLSDNAQGSTPGPVDPLVDEYAEQARKLVSGIMRGRSGLGALRNFDSIYRARAHLPREGAPDPAIEFYFTVR